MNINRSRQVDRNGNVSWRVTRDGVHLGDVIKLAGGKWRPELVNGDHGPDGTIKAATEWIGIYAKPTAEAITEQIRRTTWELDVHIPDQLKGETHARRVASLRNQRTENQQILDRLVTELGAATQEQRR